MADKLIINELLTFVQNKIDVLDELSIAQICGSNFTDDEVEKGKAVLYNAFPASKVPLRRGEDKKKKDLKDIIKILKESDPIDLPTFVAKDLNRLPPVSFDHVDVTRLLKDINILKTDLQTMKADSVSKMELANLDMKISTELTGLKSTIQKADTQCKKKKTNNMNISTTPKRNDNRLTLMPTPACNVTGSPEPIHTPSYRDIIREPRQKRGNSSSTAPRQTGNNSAAATEQSASRTAKDNVVNHNFTDDRPNDDNGKFTTVVNRKTKRRNLRGSLQNSTRILVNEPKVFIYVSRTKKSTTAADIISHISDMNESCVGVELLKQNKELDFNSFKIAVNVGQLEKFLSNDFWPSGLVFRRYRERATPITATNNKL
ncbi:hypothetical protein O0L34_g16054 [Tuta absoluta]|nr:hypothetical protein O0L34_g16054 [Tuta absoluta]